jgi:hypothetical protein
MGFYINPKGQSKEEWLMENGTPVSLNFIIDLEDKDIFDVVPVCLVDNGPFRAAAIGYCKREIEAFSLPEDHRPKWFFLVSLDRLKPFIPDKFYKEIQSRKEI